MTDKRYKLIFSASDARKIMKLGRSFPVDIKKNKNPRELDKPSVFVFEKLDDQDYKVICNPVKARGLLRDGFKLVDIKENSRPKSEDCPTVFVFEITDEFLEDLSKINNN